MEMTRVFVVAVAACFCVTLLSDIKPEFALLIRISAVTVIALLALDPIAELIINIQQLVSSAELSVDRVNLLLKALIIAAAGRIVCDFCLDSGNRAVCAITDLICRLSIVLLSLPMLKALVVLCKELING